MSKMGQEFKNRLDGNKYELYRVCKAARDALRAGFSHNPDVGNAEEHVGYLQRVLVTCRKDLEGVIKAIERGEDGTAV